MMRSKSSKPHSSGFSLIELLIVVAIIGILAGVIIPAFHSSVRKANEAAAVTAVNTIKIAQAKYAIDHEGHYGTFAELYKSGLLDKRFNNESPHIRGYIFVLTLVDKPQRAAASFQIRANPELSEGLTATGGIFYYSEPDAGVSYSREGPADSDDELL
jgi:prepilin-type N-terminal cleavage/methylation domain-containing protein